MDRQKTEVQPEPEEKMEIEFIDVDSDGLEEIPCGDSGGEYQEKISALEAEIEHLREMYLRKMAEFDNFRKRVEREKAEMHRFAGEGLITDLLPVLDNFERALEHSSDTAPEAFKLGVEMISNQFLDVLQRRGLERFNPIGQAFEPEFHEAIQRVEDSEHPPGTIAWVLSPGYRFGGRLLRPAMVGVSVGAQTDESAVSDQASGGVDGEQ